MYERHTIIAVHVPAVPMTAPNVQHSVRFGKGCGCPLCLNRESQDAIFFLMYELPPLTISAADRTQASTQDIAAAHG